MVELMCFRSQSRRTHTPHSTWSSGTTWRGDATPCESGMAPMKNFQAAVAEEGFRRQWDRLSGLTRTANGWPHSISNPTRLLPSPAGNDEPYDTAKLKHKVGWGG